MLQPTTGNFGLLGPGFAGPIDPMSRPCVALSFSFVLSAGPLALSACGEEPNAESATSETGDGDGDQGDGDGDGDALRPNWHQDIAPLVHANCLGCHVDGSIAPFSLETYEAAAIWSALMNDAVAD